MRGWLRLPALRPGDYSNVSASGAQPLTGRQHLDVAEPDGSCTTAATLLAALVPQVVGFVDVEERAPRWIRRGPRRLVDDGDTERVQQRPE